MSFDNIARSLIKQTSAPASITGSNDRTIIIKELEEAGFSRRDVFQEYRQVYDNADEASLKKQILDSISKIHGLMTPDESSRGVPQIILNIAGDNVRVDAMLCPTGQ